MENPQLLTLEQTQSVYLELLEEFDYLWCIAFEEFDGTTSE